MRMKYHVAIAVLFIAWGMGTLYASDSFTDFPTLVRGRTYKQSDNMSLRIEEYNKLKDIVNFSPRPGKPVMPDVYIPHPDDDGKMGAKQIAAIVKEYTSPSPIFYTRPNGNVALLRTPNPERDFTPKAREIFGDDWSTAFTFIASGPGGTIDDRARVILRDFENTRKLSPGPTIHDAFLAAEKIIEKLGISEAEYRYWMKHDPEYIASRIDDVNLLALSGLTGYVTAKARDPDQKEMLWEDAKLYALAEAYYRVQQGDYVAMARHEIASGFGEVGVLGLKGVAALARGIDDVAGFLSAISPYRDPNNPKDGWLKTQTWSAVDWLNEHAEYAEMNWIGAPLDTGNPAFDCIFRSIFRGGPMLATFAALAAIAYVGIKTYCRSPKTNRKHAYRTSS